ncbi:MAG: lytic murein transglycosylase [Pseudomonadota bacterium]
MIRAAFVGLTILAGSMAGAQHVPLDNQMVSSQAAFENWISTFKSRAVARGVDPLVYDQAFRGVRLNMSVIESSNYQPEFTRQIWDYLDAAVSDQRVRNGKDKKFEQRQNLVEMESRYGVDASVIVAIWGIESAYGANMGSINIIEALATLAFDSRRRTFGEQQLIEALKIIQRGDIRPNQMLGSWAGAMGHTQFIPTSYQAYAQDFTGDGRRDVWNPRDPRDALASTANYLREFGWQFGRPWGIEVSLPKGFNYNLASQENRRSAASWTEIGVRTISGDPVPNHGSAAIIAPAGANGPAFAVFNNFFVIKRYNNATSYAIAVGHLSDRISGARGFEAAWPRGEQALSFKEKQELQRRLTRKGFDTDGADGIIGPNTIAAIKAYQKSVGLPADGFATKDLLDRIR